MQEMWFYKNEKGERARLVNSGGVILAFVGRDQCRFPSVKTAQTQLSMWGYKESFDDSCVCGGGSGFAPAI